MRTKQSIRVSRILYLKFSMRMVPRDYSKTEKVTFKWRQVILQFLGRSGRPNSIIGCVPFAARPTKRSSSPSFLALHSSVFLLLPPH
jgi:hypothetical protein